VVGPASAVPRFSQVELPEFTVALANSEDACAALRDLLANDWTHTPAGARPRNASLDLLDCGAWL